MKIALIGAGEMGSAVGGRLRERGARVVTSLRGRSAASAERVGKAGLEVVTSDRELVDGAAAGYDGPRIYVSGAAAREAAQLAAFGLSIQVLDGDIGIASALKMSYAGITKGLTGIGAAMMLDASRSGVAAALRSELQSSQPQIFAWLARQVPRMYPKAYRWVAEMEEIAAFSQDDPGTETIYEGLARLYEGFAAAYERRNGAPDAMLAALTEFVK